MGYAFQRRQTPMPTHFKEERPMPYKAGRSLVYTTGIWHTDHVDELEPGDINTQVLHNNVIHKII